MKGLIGYQSYFHLFKPIDFHIDLLNLIGNLLAPLNRKKIRSLAVLLVFIFLYIAQIVLLYSL